MKFSVLWPLTPNELDGNVLAREALTFEDGSLLETKYCFYDDIGLLEGTCHIALPCP